MKKKKGKVILIILGIIFFLWFGNTFTRGIFNMGNTTGAVISCAMIIYGIFMDRIKEGIKNLWKKRAGKVTIIAVMAIVAVILVLAGVTMGCMISGWTKSPENNSVLVVLGCQVRGETPSLMLEERLNAAEKYLVSNPDAVCIVSGGKGTGEDISEAECMYRWLTSHGIKEERIYKEDKSTSTDENIRFSKQIIDEKKLGTSISIATNEFHEYRAGKIAEKYGLSHGSVPAPTAWWLIPTYYVREMYGILAEKLFG